MNKKEITTGSAIRSYSETYNRIAGGLLSDGLKTGENIVLSPYSIIVLLAIAAAATNGNAREEILASMFPGLSYKDVLALIKALSSDLSDKRILSVANAVCINNSIKDSLNPWLNSDKELIKLVTVG